MKKEILLTIIYIIYSLPYGYFAMYQDYKNNSMLGYGVIFLVMIIAPIIAKSINIIIKVIPIIICNLISFIISNIFLKDMMGERWNVYFKPLTPSQFLLLICIINSIISVIAIYIVITPKYNK